jgi:hypothetical protein
MLANPIVWQDNRFLHLGRIELVIMNTAHP